MMMAAEGCVWKVTMAVAYQHDRGRVRLGLDKPDASVYGNAVAEAGGGGRRDGAGLVRQAKRNLRVLQAGAAGPDAARRLRHPVRTKLSAASGAKVGRQAEQANAATGRCAVFDPRLRAVSEGLASAEAVLVGKSAEEVLAAIQTEESRSHPAPLVARGL